MGQKASPNARAQALPGLLEMLGNFAGSDPASAGMDMVGPLGMAGEKLLHGTKSIFDKFKPGREGAIFLSKPQKGIVTQAEQIARGRMGGNLLDVEVRNAGKIKKFDPLNDAKAADILKAAETPGGKAMPGTVHYQDLAAVIQEAEKRGEKYNRFRVYEPSVRGTSEAFTDPDLLEIVNSRRVENTLKGKDWSDPKVVAQNALEQYGNRPDVAIQQLKGARKANKEAWPDRPTPELDEAIKILMGEQ